jgi:uncharacterized protein involved in response to NO
MIRIKDTSLHRCSKCPMAGSPTTSLVQRFTRHPVWLAGFRPLFIATLLAGAWLPLVWIAIFLGAVPPAPTFAVSPQQWHAHEMFFGFGAAVVGGFLLTASKNWLSIRGHHGTTLIFLCAAWLLDRIALGWGALWPPALFWIASSLYVGGLVFLVAGDLIRHHAKDSFPDNIYFVFALPWLLPAKFLLLTTGLSTGTQMSIAIFRLILLLIMERTLTQFMAGIFKVTILRKPWLDHSTKLLALALIAAPWLPSGWVALLEWLLALLLFGRLLFWHLRKAMTRIDIGIMHLTYLMLVLQLMADAASQMFAVVWIGTVSVHLFTVGTLGIVVPAMMIRISKGHTGRPVAFDMQDKAALWLMIVAATSRVLAPQLWPAAYPIWLWLTALLWLLVFSRLAWRFVPYLLSPRVDGREH